MDNLSPFTKNIYTKQEALRNLSLFTDFLTSLLFGGQPQNTKAAIKKFAQNQSDLDWLNSIDENFIAQFNQQNFKSGLQEIEKKLKDSKTILIDLPIDLPKEYITQVGQYLRDKLNLNYFMEIKINPSLIAGAAIGFNGVYKDYSVKGKIADNKTTIINIFKTFLSHK